MKGINLKKTKIKKAFNKKEIINKKPCYLMRIGKNFDNFLLLWA